MESCLETMQRGTENREMKENLSLRNCNYSWLPALWNICTLYWHHWMVKNPPAVSLVSGASGLIVLLSTGRNRHGTLLEKETFTLDSWEHHHPSIFKGSEQSKITSTQQNQQELEETSVEQISKFSRFVIIRHIL